MLNRCPLTANLPEGRTVQRALLALGPRIVTPGRGKGWKSRGSYANGDSVHLAHADEREADEHGHPAAGGRLGGRLPWGEA